MDVAPRRVREKRRATCRGLGANCSERMVACAAGSECSISGATSRSKFGGGDDGRSDIFADRLAEQLRTDDEQLDGGQYDTAWRRPKFKHPEPIRIAVTESAQAASL